MAKLVVNPSSSQKREILLPRTVLSIGRDPSNDLVLPDAMVSRRHAVVEWRGSQFFIRDCNSSNGSLVNGDRVSERGLRDGDLVAIGTARLLFRDDVVEEPGSKVVQHPSAPRLNCSVCGADYRKGDVFCRQCGGSVAPPPPQKAVCASCGTAVLLPARFCNACGHSLPEAAPPPAPGPPVASGGGSAAVAQAAEVEPLPEPTPGVAEPTADPQAPPERPAPAAAAALPEPEPQLEAIESQELKPLEPPHHEPKAVVTVLPTPPSHPPRVAEPSLTLEPVPPPARPSVSPRPHRPVQPRPPGQEPLRPAAPASAGARLLAALVDAVVVSLVQGVIVAPAAWYWWGRELPAEPGQVPFLPILLSLIAVPVALLIGIGYYVWGWGVAGATPGKRLLGLVVETGEGSHPIGAGRAFVRLIGYAISALPLGVGFLLIPLAGEGLHDKIAGTRVARAKE